MAEQCSSSTLDDVEVMEIEDENHATNAAITTNEVLPNSIIVRIDINEEAATFTTKANTYITVPNEKDALTEILALHKADTEFIFDLLECPPETLQLASQCWIDFLYETQKVTFTGFEFNGNISWVLPWFSNLTSFNCWQGRNFDHMETFLPYLPHTVNVFRMDCTATRPRPSTINQCMRLLYDYFSTRQCAQHIELLFDQEFVFEEINTYILPLSMMLKDENSLVELFFPKSIPHEEAIRTWGLIENQAGFVQSAMTMKPLKFYFGIILQRRFQFGFLDQSRQQFVNMVI